MYKHVHASQTFDVTQQEILDRDKDTEGGF
jgi:hypothetical protein